MALEGSHEEHIIVNGTLLSGIQNISFSQNVQEQAVSYLGNDFGGTTINGPTVVSAAIDKVLLNEAKNLCFKGNPIVIIMKTEMGNGVDFMMGTHKWHGVAPNDEQLKLALDQNPETIGDY